jgi:anti-sigma B factor antagonist/serine/threonine-protein kinase RsbW
MNVTFQKPAGHASSLIGRLDGAFNENGAITLWETASEIVDDDNRYVVLDLTGVTMVTSSGLGILVRLYTRLRGLGGGLAIFGCSAKIREVIDLVMLTDILKVSATEADAWQALGL